MTPPPICFLFEGVSKTTYRRERKTRHFSDFQIKRTKTKNMGCVKEKLINLSEGDRFRFPKRKNVNTVIRIYEFNGSPCLAYRSTVRLGFVSGDRMYKEVHVIGGDGKI